MGIQWGNGSVTYGLKGGYDSLWREVFCNVLTEVVMSMKLLKLTEMFLNENCSIVQLSKHLSDILPSKNCLIQWDTGQYQF